MRKIILLLVFFTAASSAQWTIDTNGIGNKEIDALAYSGNNFFAGTLSQIPSGVYLSTNNGTSCVLTALNNQTVGSLAISGNNIFAGGNDVYLSTNNGTSWTQTYLNQTISSLGVNGSNVFASTFNIRVYLSTNNG